MNKITHKLKLETISPVSIGDGGSLSPLSDYVIDENELYFIDQQIFESYLEEDRKMLEKFTNGVYRVSNKNKANFLKDFIQYDLEEELDGLCKYSVPVFYDKQFSPLELHTIEKSVNRPYVPGSTLKGAIKWAILYKYIKENNKINSFINKIKQQSAQKKSDKEKEKEVDNAFKKIENEVFGDIKNGTIKRMPFSMLKIGDSQPAKIRAQVFEFVREHLRKGTKVISQLREAIKDETFMFKLTVSQKFDHPNLNFFNEEKPYSLFAIINETVSDIIRFEIEIIEKSEIGAETDDELLSDLVHFYECLLKRIETNQNKLAFIPIGFAKNYFLNSIGLLIKQQDEEVFTMLRKIYGSRMGKRGQLFFPVTRYVCFSESYMPAGWVKISEAKYEEKESEETINGKQTNEKRTLVTKLELQNYPRETIKNGTTVTARVLKVERPQSLIEIIIEEEPVLVRMTGTKKAQKEGSFEEDCIVKVKLTVKNGEITQTQFVSF